MDSKNECDFSPVRVDLPPLHGLALRAALLPAESFAGPSLLRLLQAFSAPQLGEILRAVEYAEAPRCTGVPPEWGAPTPVQPGALGDEVLELSHDGRERLEAALRSIDQAGTTLMPTSMTARPTVLDYHYVYEQGACAQRRSLNGAGPAPLQPRRRLQQRPPLSTHTPVHRPPLPRCCVVCRRPAQPR